MSPEQCRSARGWLDWSQQKLADEARLGLSTVRDFEKGRRQPLPESLTEMQGALERAGIKLVFKNGVGIGVQFYPA